MAAIFAICVFFIFILIIVLSFKLVSYLLLLIPKHGLQFLILKCPRCYKRGGLKKTWEFSIEKENYSENNIDVIDIEMVIGREKILLCKKCNHKISL